MVAGGVLTDVLSWRSTMGLLSVFALIVLPLAPGLLPESRTPTARAWTFPARSPSPAVCWP